MQSPYRLTGNRISFNTAGDNVILASNKTPARFRIFRLRLTVLAATVLTIKDGSGTILEVFQLGANGAINLEAGEHAHYATTAPNDFIISSSVATQVEGRVSYVSET